MKTKEYSEGPKAREDFERTMVALFRAPKPESKQRKEKAAKERKMKKADKD